MDFAMNKRFANVNGWTISAVFIIILLFLPNLSIVLGIFAPASENWTHIKEFMLLNYIKTTLTLVFFTALFTISIGLSLAWLIAQYNFPLTEFHEMGANSSFIDSAFYWCLYISRHHKLHGGHSKDTS